MSNPFTITRFENAKAGRLSPKAMADLEKRSCLRKIRHAEPVAPLPPKMACYECLFCGGWHMTKMLVVPGRQNYDPSSSTTSPADQ